MVIIIINHTKIQINHVLINSTEAAFAQQQTDTYETWKELIEGSNLLVNYIMIVSTIVMTANMKVSKCII